MGHVSEQCVIFGNFSSQDYDNYFIRNGIQSVGVEFLCDTFNATKCWVEEGSKHTFSYLEKIEPNFADSTSKENVHEEHVEEDYKATDTDTKPMNGKLGNPKEGTEDHLSKDPEATKPPSSWASLFKGSSTTPNSFNNGASKAPGILSIQMEQEKEKQEDRGQTSVSLISMSNDHRALSLAEQINRLAPNYNRHHLQLRGLINRGNWCYINTTLQALLGISAISHFYKALKAFANANTKSTSTPLTDSMVLFFNEFEPINPKFSLKKQAEDLRAGTAFEPRCVYDVLPVMKTTLSEKGRQEDAEEFLSFILNGIHDELVDLQKLVKNNMDPATTNGIDSGASDHESDTAKINGSDEESWAHVGKKNKASSMRKAVIEESLIKHVFGGVIRSSVHQTGKKESTTLQPFFTLQLDIQSEKIWTLKEALESYFMKESLQGFTCTTTNTEVEASRRTSIEGLPLVLIFHLKYFVFDRKGGCQKIHKALDIPVSLEIPKDIISANLKTKLAGNTRNYKLCAVVYHHGKNAAGGHYTAAVHHGNPFGWVHFDDNNIKPVNVNHVLKHQQGCVPYLLFYERVQAR